MDQSERLTIKVKNQDGNCLHYNVKADTRMSKVMHAYCKKKNLHSNTVRFLYNGKRVAKNQTPASLQMKNGDEIDAMMHMSGGGGPGGSHNEHEHMIGGTKHEQPRLCR